MSTRRSSDSELTAARTVRQRLSRDARFRQLLAVAWSIVQTDGTEALSLGTLAERAGVTKPVVYDHFRDRNGLLSALYLEFDAKQNRLIDEAVTDSPPELAARAEVIANGFVDCVLAQGREIPGVVAALTGSPELASIRRSCEKAFLEKCARALDIDVARAPLALPGLHAILGAAEALSSAAVDGTIAPSDAKLELRQLIVEVVGRQKDARLPQSPAA